MAPLFLQSEKYSPTGNTSANGVRKLLENSGLERLVLLTRESIQNSWDAKLEATADVVFDGRRLNDLETRYLKSEIFNNCPKEGMNISDFLAKNNPFFIFISDYGTKGLCGPTRADDVRYDGEPRFVNFLRNIGSEKDMYVSEAQGGTYGYGKASYFLASSINSVIVYTRPKETGVSRFMVAGLGKVFIKDGVKYTGRHWWGISSEDIAEPLTGRDADNAAKSLGIPVMHGDIYGTTFGIPDPVLDKKTPRQAMELINAAILFYAWPKVVTETMHFKVLCDKQELPQIAPESHPVFRYFTEAYRLTCDTEFVDHLNPESMNLKYRVTWRKEQKALGLVAIVKFVPNVAKKGASANLVYDCFPEIDPTIWEAIIPFGNSVGHIARIRNPELVVDYLACDDVPPGPLWYAGVFKADPDMNNIFAKSEPAAHDKWSAAQLSGDKKSYVNVAERKVSGIKIYPAVNSQLPGETAALVRFSKQLAGALSLEAALLPVQQGTGGRRGVIPSPRKKLTTAKAVLIASPKINGPGNISLQIQVNHAVSTDGTLIKLVPGVILDGDSYENSPPERAAVPKVESWRSDGDSVQQGANPNEYFIPENASNLTVSVSVPEESRIGIDLLVVN